MNCPECGMPPKVRDKRAKTNAGISSPASLLEFTAVVLFVTAFFQGGNPAALQSCLLHRLRPRYRATTYRSIKVAECTGCKKEFVAPSS